MMSFSVSEMVKPYDVSQYASLLKDVCKGLCLTALENSNDFRSEATQLNTQARPIYGCIMTTGAHFLLHHIAQLKPGSFFVILDTVLAILSFKQPIQWDVKEGESSSWELGMMSQRCFFATFKIIIRYVPYTVHSPIMRPPIPHLHLCFSRCLTEEV